ncbi:hypothetical protein NC652_036724 [Populus alba x Populus x berolinensis]|nr:hypothetical protein NC652_036724 [Populus alba x Populus x berolinensis]
MKREIGFVSSLGRTTQSSSSCVHLSDDDLNKRFKVTKVIPPSQFEIHAIKQYRRAAQYICFENGKNLLDVLNACRAAPLDSLETTIQSVISGLPVERTFTCKRCKGIFPSICVGKIGPLCNLCAESKESYPTLTIGSSIISSSPEQVLALEYFKPASLSTSSQYNTLRKKKRKSSKTDLNKSAPVRVSSRIQSKITSKISKSVLLSKSFKNATPGISSHKTYQWKITTKLVSSFFFPSYSLLSFFTFGLNVSSHSSVLCLLLLLLIWPLRLHRLVFEEGGLPDGTELAYYARGQKLLGGYKMGFGILCHCCNCEVSPSTFKAHAAMHVFTHLMAYRSMTWQFLSQKVGKYSSQDNDDLCIICADGGDLLICDGCPRAFHKGCASLSTVPSGNWYCQHCQNTFQRETGYDFMRSGFGPRTIILCDQCEKEFHVGCLRSHKMANLKELPKGNWFCCMDCSRIHSTLQKLRIRGAEKLPDSLLNDIKKQHEEKGLNMSNSIDVRWMLLSGKIASPENKLLLSRALSIFQECFDPIVDSTIGRDLIPLMVYGSALDGRIL